MVSILKATQALGQFVFGWLFTIIAWYAIPAFIDLHSSNTLKGIFWVGMFFMAVALIIIRPANTAIKAMQEE